MKAKWGGGVSERGARKATDGQQVRMKAKQQQGVLTGGGAVEGLVGQLFLKGLLAFRYHSARFRHELKARGEGAMLE